MSGLLAALSPRHQLAAYSPIPLPALARAVAGAVSPRTAVDVAGSLVRRELAAERVVLTRSGTQALQLAIGVARGALGRDAAIALPAFGCYDLASAAVGAGGAVHLYDVDPDTLGPDMASLERAMAAGAHVVVIAPLYGVPVPWDSLASAAAAHGAVLVEDAAQGHGAAWCGKPLGTFGDVSVVSFGRGKGWTGGSGGALLLRGSLAGVLPEPVPRAGSAKTVVGLAAQYVLGRPAFYGVPRRLPFLALGETVYHPPVTPQGIDGAAAAALVATARASEEEAVQRRMNARLLLDRLGVIPGVRMIAVAPEAKPGYLRLPFRVSGGWRTIGKAEGASRVGLAPSYPMVMRGVPALAPQLAGALGGWPGAEALVAELVTAPTHSLVRDDERERIVAILGGSGDR